MSDLIREAIRDSLSYRKDRLRILKEYKQKEMDDLDRVLAELKRVRSEIDKLSYEILEMERFIMEEEK